jgi:transposase
VLKVDDYGAIRRAHRDGKSVRQLAREFEHSRNTIRHVLKNSEPRPVPARRNRTAPQLGAFHAIIDQILADDEEAPRKQRHTAAQLFRRLQGEQGYRGSYSPVQRYVSKHRRSRRETFIPLGHLPGQRLEADFGHISVDFPDGRRQVPFLAITWAYSNYPFVIALPFERTEAILAGMTAGFEFFGCVPREVWWDNPKTVATLILPGRQRQIHHRYQALASHFRFAPHFCTPRRGNEKPDVESTVKAVQRRFATPVPSVTTLDDLNARLRKWCEAELERSVQSLTGPFRIATRFAEDRAAAAPLPDHHFDPCVFRVAEVDKYQTVAFDCNRYSVPRSAAFQMVTVKGYVDKVLIVSESEIIATHQRSLEKGAMILDQIHYLATLERRPAALDHSPLYRDWNLPACFGELRADLEQRYGATPGARRYVRVLQLLAEHPGERVRQAIEDCRRRQAISAEAVLERTRTLAALEARASCPLPAGVGSITVFQVQVPLPDLALFNQLLTSLRDQDPQGGEAATSPGDDSFAESQCTRMLA